MRTGLRHGFRLGDRLVLPSQGRIVGPSGSRHVPSKVLEVLLCLAETPGEIVARERIVQRVWGRSAAAGEALTHCISELRRHLGDDPHRPRYIETVPRRGYRLVAPVEPAPETTYPESSNVTVPAAATPRNKSSVLGFIDQLRRRKVLRVAAVYAVVAWLIMQIAEVTFAPLGIPPWAQTLVIVLLLLGFPAALILAWALELTPQGLVVDTDERQASPGRPIDYIIVASLVVAVAVVGWHIVARDERPASTVASAGTGLGTAGAPANSIAVMPFVSIGTDVQNAYFADGLAEELLGLLGKLGELKVAARTSSFYFRNKDVGLAEISKRLGVRHILEGTVRRDGNDVRVRAELVDTSTGFNIWSATYDRELEDIFAIQDDIATAVVNELKLVLSVESEAELARRPTDNVESYDLYLRAQGLRRGAGNTVALDEALDIYSQALAIDPDFAEAHAGACLAYLEKYERSAATQNYEAAEQACQRALNFEGAAAEVHTALGNLFLASGEHDEAEAEFDKAIDLDDQSVDAYRGLGRSLAALNRFGDAELALRRAIALEPGYWASYESLGGFYFSRSRFAEAADAYRRLATLRPDFADGFSNLGAAYHLQGDFEAAAAAYAHSLELAPTREAYSNTGSMYFYLGRLDDAVNMYLKSVELAPEDHRLWGYLADAYFADENSERKALEAYRTAIPLAEARREVNPADAETLSSLAHYYANIGQADLANRLLAQALELAPENMYVRYDEALVHAQLGDTEQALQAIEKAVELGYLPALLPVDPGLSLLAGNIRFKQLYAKRKQQPDRES